MNRSIQIWARILGIVLTVGFLGGCQSRKVIVTVDGWSDTTQTLYVSSALGSRLGDSITVSRDQTRFIINLPNEQNGWFTINAATMADDGNKYSVATASTQIEDKTTFPVEITLKLCKLPVPTTASWVPYCNPSDAEVNVIHGSNPNSLYAVSNQGPPDQRCTLLQWNGSEWHKFEDPAIGYFVRVIGLGMTDIWVSSFFDGIAHYDGIRWIRTAPGSETGIVNPGPYFGFCGRDNSDIWAAGNNGYVLHWNGTRWNQMTHVAIPKLQLGWLWCDNSGTVWNVGATAESAGKVYSFDVSRLNPTIDLKMITGIAKKLNHITGIDKDNILVSADDGLVFILRNGEWKRFDTGVLSSFQSGIMFSAQDAWLVGDNGKIVHWNGVKFIETSTNTSNKFWSIWGTSSNDLWAVGSGTRDRIYRFIP